MVNVVSRRCDEPNCKTIPTYGYKEEGFAKYCASHRLTRMIDVVNKRCIFDEGCNIKANPKYKNYCFEHFRDKFPNHIISRNHREKESAVVCKLNECFSDYNLVFNRNAGSCNRRPDILFNRGTYYIIVEIDEKQHKTGNYNNEDDEIRNNEIFNGLGNKPIVIIRFNPDSYYNKLGKYVYSCWTNSKGKCQISERHEHQWTERLDTLQTRIHYWIEHEPTDSIHTEYLFFNECNVSSEESSESSEPVQEVESVNGEVQDENQNDPPTYARPGEEFFD
jgi:hypothetical protein